MLIERKYEDKADIFSPFVPLDKKNIIEVCDKELICDIRAKTRKQCPFRDKNIMYIVLSCIIIFLVIKRYINK